MSNTPYEISATNSAQQSIPNNVITGLTFDTVASGQINTGGLTSIAGQVTLPFSGVYQIYLSVGLASGAAGIYNQYVTVNTDVAEYGNDGIVAASSQRVDLVTNITKRFSAGDVIKFNVNQVTGGAINVGTGTNNRAKLFIIKLSD